MKRLIQYVVLAAVILLGVGIGVATDMNSTVMAVITVIGCIVALILIESIFAKRQRSDQEHIQIDAKENKIVLLQRGQVSRSYLRCSEHMPPSAGLPRTGKYYIYSKDYDRKVVIIDKICFSGDLLEAAKKSPKLQKFLVGDHLELRHQNADTSLTAMELEVLKQAVRTNNQSVQNSITHRAYMASRLTRAECMDILDWIAGL